jgi:predicted DNA-binding helix-hairpin-helix protein
LQIKKEDFCDTVSINIEVVKNDVIKRINDKLNKNKK